MRFAFTTLLVLAAAQFSVLMDPSGSGLRSISLGSGTAVALLLVWGWKLWPAVLLAFGAAGLFTESPLVSLLGAGLRTSEVLLAVYLAHRWITGPQMLQHPLKVFRFFALAFAVPLVFVPLIALHAAYASGSGFPDLSSLTNLWNARVLGLLVGTPLILAWLQREKVSFFRQRPLEFSLLAVAYLLICVALLVPFEQTRGIPRVFFLIPILLWVALRFGKRETYTAIFFLAVFLTLATHRGQGPFTLPDPHLSFSLMQSFLAMIAMMALVLSADVGERGATEDKLRVSEQRYHDFFERNPQPLWVYDFETLFFLDANEAALDLYGYTRDELLQLRITQIRPEQDIPDLLKAVPRVSSHLVQSGQWRHRRKDGSLIWVNVSRQDLLFGNRHAVLVLCEDITQRRRAESRLATLARLGRQLGSAASSSEAAKQIADAADAMLEWDAFSVSLCSPEKQRMQNIYCVDLINGQRTVVTHQDYPHAPGPISSKALREGPQLILRVPGEGFAPNSVPFGDVSRPAQSIMTVPVTVSQQTVAVITAQSYRPQAYTLEDLQILQSLADHCGAALDRVRATTELAELNQQLEQRIQERTTQLEAMNKELEAFSYSVSHDLRAPLRSIRGFTEVLMESHCGSLDPDGQNYLRRTAESARFMERLIEDILMLSRLGRAQMQMTSVPISEVVQSIANEITAGNPQRKVQWLITPNLHACADPRLLRVLLNNLLQNAFKFTGRTDSPVIEFGHLPEAPTPTYFVRDNGAGFDMQFAGKLFGVFQRLHPASEFPGTGVGLATVQRITTRHGGRVWAHSAPKQGATFFFTLPPDACH